MWKEKGKFPKHQDFLRKEVTQNNGISVTICLVATAVKWPDSSDLSVLAVTST